MGEAERPRKQDVAVSTSSSGNINLGPESSPDVFVGMNPELAHSCLNAITAFCDEEGYVPSRNSSES